MSSAQRHAPWRLVCTLVLRELSGLVAALALVLGGGILVAARRRQLHIGAVAVSLVLSALLLAALTLGIRNGWSHGEAPPGALLWAFGLGMAAVCGITCGRMTRRLAVWELELTLMILAVSLAVALGPWGQHLWYRFVLGAHRMPTHLGLLALGPRLLGPLWDRMLGLWLPMGLAVGLVASSLTLLRSGFACGEVVPRLWALGLEWRLAQRHLGLGHKAGLSAATVVTVLGVALGVAALVVVTAVMSGYQEDIRSKILGTNAHLVVQKYGLDFVEDAKVISATKQLKEVRAAAPFVFNEVMLQFGRQGVGTLLKGIEPQSSMQATTLAQTLCLPESTAEPGACTPAGQAGGQLLTRLLKRSETGERLAPVILGAVLQARLGVRPGDHVALMTPVGMAGLRGNAARRQNFEVVGTFKSGLHEFDSHLVYTEMSAAQHLLGMGRSISGVELRLFDAEKVGLVSQAVLRAVGHYPYRTLDWRQLNASIFTALALQKVVMALVLIFIVVVASFNIASTLFMAVVERAPHIAVLKSMGISDASIMTVFVLEGWLTGLMGTALGLLLGLGATMALSGLKMPLASDVYMVDALRVLVRPSEVIQVVVAALGICHLATLYPALRAARALPAEVLRGAMGTQDQREV